MIYPRHRTDVSPLFVLAPARSCSSVVVTMLGGHPALYGFPELRLFATATVEELFADRGADADLSPDERTAGLLRAVAEVFLHSQSEPAIEWARAWLAPHRSGPGSRVLDALLDGVAPAIGVEKSPESTLSDIALGRMATAYPAARHLHLIRHPWTTVRSMVAAWSPLPNWNRSRRNPYERCAEVWLEQHRRIDIFVRALPSWRWHRVSAEAVVNQPLTVLPELCTWLGIDDSRTSLARMLCTERSPFANPGPRRAPGGLDPSFLHRPALRRVAHPTSLDPPADWQIRPAIIDAVRRLWSDLSPGAIDTRPVAAGQLSARRRLASPSHLRTVRR